jgi:hypothetical protein
LSARAQQTADDTGVGHPNLHANLASGHRVILGKLEVRQPRIKLPQGLSRFGRIDDHAFQLIMLKYLLIKSFCGRFGLIDDHAFQLMIQKYLCRVILLAASGNTLA